MQTVREHFANTVVVVGHIHRSIRAKSHSFDGSKQHFSAKAIGVSDLGARISAGGSYNKKGANILKKELREERKEKNKGREKRREGR